MNSTNLIILERLADHSRIDLRGIELLVSNIDIPRIMQYRWYADTHKIQCDNLFYVKARIFYAGKHKYVSMHRFILDAYIFDGVHVVDHINQNSRDNRRENLRLTDIHTNLQNSRKNKEKNILSPYKRYSSIERDNTVPAMRINRISYRYVGNVQETIFAIDTQLYKICTIKSVYFSRRNKFGYPGLSYDKQHKKIVVIKNRKKYGFYSDIMEALERAYKIYTIPYTLQILNK